MRTLLGWILAAITVLWRATCRYRVVADPRAALRARGQPYVYALLHAHQVAAVFCNDEPHLGAMVSRSGDGALLVPSLKLRGIIPVRGSSRRSMAGGDKGGRDALAALAELGKQKVPTLLAVDGPRGPRGRVRHGAIHLAQAIGGVLLPVVVVPSRRWTLRRTWDRMQLPQPFCRIDLIFGAPISVPSAADGASLRRRAEEALMDLAARHDPQAGLPVAHMGARWKPT